MSVNLVDSTDPSRDPFADPFVDPGRGGYPADANLHRRDAPKYCPGCAAPLSLVDGGHGIATEYWVASDRVFVCFCGGCGWAGDIVLAARVVGHEADH